MKRKLLILLVIALCLPAFSGCFRMECTHDWVRTDNYDKYTACDRCTWCQEKRMYADPDVDLSQYRSTIKIATYTNRQYSHGVFTKNIAPCETSERLAKALKELSETDETIEKISDQTVDESSKNLPVADGTLWIESDGLLYRLTPDLSQICRVETHLGSGIVLKITREIQDDLKELKSHYPYNVYYGNYKNGNTLTLEHHFVMPTKVQVEVLDLNIVNEYHSESNVTLKLFALEDCEITVRLDSYQSADNLGGGDQKTLQMSAGDNQIVKMGFGGFYNHHYSLDIFADKTLIQLHIDPVAE